MRHRVLTWNCPPRLDPEGFKRRAFLAERASNGVTVFGTQENADNDPRNLAPRGCEWYRPEVERSAAVIWDARIWLAIKKGEFRLNSDDWSKSRHIVWVLLRHRVSGDLMRFGSCHLPAFKTTSDARATEYRHQEERAAAWLNGGARRVLVGDFNATPGGKWMANLEEVGVHCRPLLDTGPHNTPIDLVWRRKGQPAPEALRALDGPSDHKALVCAVTL